MNLAKEPIEAYLTSFSASLSKFVKIYINETSATSFPKASANSENIFERDSLTLQDLSSVAPIIIYNVYCLFSSLFNTLATNFKLFKPKTLT